MVTSDKATGLRKVLQHRTFGALVLGQLVTAVGALLINVAAARALGAEGRGELALFLQLSYLLGAGVMLGRDIAFPASTDNHAPIARRLTRLLRLPMAVGIALSAVLGLAITSAVGPVIGAVTLIALVAGNLVARALRTYAICANSTRGYLVAVLLSQVGTVGGSFALLLLSSVNTATWLGVYAVSTLAPAAVILFMARAIEAGEAAPGGVDSPHARALGWKLAPSYFFDFAASRVDRLAIPLLAGYAQLGLYIVFATMVELTIWPMRQFVDSSVPRWAAQARAGTLRPLRILGTSALAILPISAVVGVVVYLLAVPLYGEEYRDGMRLIVPLSVGVALHALVLVFVGIATAENRAGVATTITITTLAVSLVLYGVMIPSGGAFGAAIALACAYVCGAIAGLIGLLRTARSARAEAGHVDAKESARV